MHVLTKGITLMCTHLKVKENALEIKRTCWLVYDARMWYVYLCAFVWEFSCQIIGAIEFCPEGMFWTKSDTS